MKTPKEHRMEQSSRFNRRNLLKVSLAVGGSLALGSGARLASGQALSSGAARAVSPAAPPLARDARRPVPLRVGVNELIDIKCCLRPFRPFGPRLEAEQIGDTLVIHNYGHGGSGWSLSWGCAEIAVEKAMSVLPKEIAVIGCGIIGLTAAVVAQRAGAKATIYAREMIYTTRSLRAGGVWSPDSRISLTAQAGPQFGELWERMARLSWKSWRTYLGLPERPVEFGDYYVLSEKPMEPPREELDPGKGTFATAGMPQQNAEFGSYSDRIKDIVPQPETVAPEENPFGTPYAQRSSMLHFNFAAYTHLLMGEFLASGGKFEHRDFHSPADVVALKEKVVINCPGYAGRDLWRDKTIIPVRGQTGWLVPQPEANYGISYSNVLLFSKSDGVLAMYFSDEELGDMLGMGDSNELPDRRLIETGLTTIAPLFERMKTRVA
jgi:glycine/D-amino acid oxidase-like deaminating enzyme